jgi:hypothetical protein
MLPRLSMVSLLWLATAASQTPSPIPVPQSGGIESPWGVRAILAEIVKGNEKLQPLLASLDPQAWSTQKGASTAYIVQWQTARRQVNDVVISSQLLSQKTESLPLALDDYFRLEALEISVRSLEEGARKYADRATADQLSASIAHNFTTRERLRDYIRELAVSVDQNFKVADAEAQRCRGIISREPTAAHPSKKH